MTITLHIPQELEKKLESLAAAGGFADAAAYVQDLVEKDVQQKTGDLAREFRRLAEQWRAETRYFSFGQQRAEHPAYRQIVALGEAAVPLILAELERRPGHWFQALREITGANPIPEEARGKMKEMTEAWLRWGREHGYQW